MVYRDVKQENIGFDIRGDVKLFDFGLCKSLDEKWKAKGHGYQLTPYTGSVPYMAPEVGKGLPYDQSADVFSFAILVWETLALTTAFRGYSHQKYVSRVCKSTERPRIPQSWPIAIRSILAEAWDDEPQERPSMAIFAKAILGCLQDLTNDSSVLNRIEGMSNRDFGPSRMLKRSASSLSVAAEGTCK